MAKFHNIQVQDIYKVTKDCSVVTFQIPDELVSEFQYNQGQHLTLKTIIDGEDIRRSYSLCSSPIENKWQVAVKKIPGGLFSSFINENLKKGDFVEIMAPSGKFNVEVNPEKAKNYIVFCSRKWNHTNTFYHKNAFSTRIK